MDTAHASQIKDFLNDVDETLSVIDDKLKRIAEAVEYDAYINFQRLMIDTAEVIVKKDAQLGAQHQANKHAALVEAFLARVMVPPFEARIKEALVASRIKVSVVSDEEEEKNDG